MMYLRGRYDILLNIQGKKMADEKDVETTEKQEILTRPAYGLGAEGELLNQIAAPDRKEEREKEKKKKKKSQQKPVSSISFIILTKTL